MESGVAYIRHLIKSSCSQKCNTLLMQASESTKIKKAEKKELRISFILSLPSFRSSPASSTIIIKPIPPSNSVNCTGKDMCHCCASEKNRSKTPAISNSNTEGIFAKFEMIEKKYDTTITVAKIINTSSVGNPAMKLIYAV